MTAVIRIANCSGFYGDRLAAAREMVEGGPIDVLTGDYLAELTMSILHAQSQSRGGQAGYVGTFLKQLEEVASTCADRGIKIIVNAGGLNPRGMAQETERILSKLGLSSKVAWIDGDDILKDLARLSAEGEPFTNLDTGAALVAGGRPLTANIYLGAWGIKAALEAGADIVICPRVTDAALAIGPAAWRFNWRRNDYDALAGALAAGHIIECGAQCCGGNYSFFHEVPSFRNVGYPIAEIEADGSFTITKHPGTGGLVSVGTVTAQLLYEIGAPAYVNPDVVAHFDTLRIAETGPNRVRVSGCRGSSPPPQHKVCILTEGPAKQSFEILLTGLDIERKAEIYLDSVFHNLGGRSQFDEIDVQLIRSDQENPASNELAQALLRVSVTCRDPAKLGRLFGAKIIELALANIPGLTGCSGGGFSGTPTTIHWPALIDSRRVRERVHLDGRTIEVDCTQTLGFDQVYYQPAPVEIPPPPTDTAIAIPLGRIFGTRSGDKGGAANCGVWARTPEAFAFLRAYLTVETFKRLCPDFAAYDIERYELPNILALNLVIRGVLAGGAASNNRIDKQAKSLGEYLGAKLIMVPKSIALDGNQNRATGLVG